MDNNSTASAGARTSPQMVHVLLGNSWQASQSEPVHGAGSPSLTSDETPASGTHRLALAPAHAGKMAAPADAQEPSIGKDTYTQADGHQARPQRPSAPTPPGRLIGQNMGRLTGRGISFRTGTKTPQ